MSLFSLASVAVARDLTARGQPLGKDATLSNLGAGAPAPGASPAGEPTVDPAATTGTTASFTQMLVAQIPSEALLAYTTLLALFTVGGGRYNAGRWGLYAAAIILCAATVLCSYLVQRKYGFDDGQTANTSDPSRSVGRANCTCRICPLWPRPCRWRSMDLPCQVRRCNTSCPGPPSRSARAAWPSAAA